MGALSTPSPRQRRRRWRQLLLLQLLMCAASTTAAWAGSSTGDDDESAVLVDDDARVLRDLFESPSQESTLSNGNPTDAISSIETTGFTGFSSSLPSASASSSTSFSASSSSTSMWSPATATFAALASAAAPPQPQAQQHPHRGGNNKKHHLRRGQRQRTNKNGNSPEVYGTPRSRGRQRVDDGAPATQCKHRRLYMGSRRTSACDGSAHSTVLITCTRMQCMS